VAIYHILLISQPFDIVKKVNANAIGSRKAFLLHLEWQDQLALKEVH
jgi:hypothetical protein